MPSVFDRPQLRMRLIANFLTVEPLSFAFARGETLSQTSLLYADVKFVGSLTEITSDYGRWFVVEVVDSVMHLSRH